MSQLTYTAVRQAVADTLSAQITGSRAVTTRFGQINPPCLLILPVSGVFAAYAVSMDGQVNYTVRVVIIASLANSESGQDVIDAYCSPVGDKSVYTAIQNDYTLGGQVGYAKVTEATAYGEMNINGVDYLTASVVVEIGD